MARDPLGRSGQVRYTRSKDEKLSQLPSDFDAAVAAITGSGGVSDGDKGDVVVSSSGTVWSLDSTKQSFLLDRANHSGSQAAGTITGLATVATTGAYSDLSGLPTIITNTFGTSVMVPAAGVYISNGLNLTALGTVAQVANRTTIGAFISGRSITIDQIGLSVSTLVASALLKIVIYDSDSNGRPTTILRETSTFNAGSTGTKFLSITALSLTAGKVYWFGVRSSSTATVRSLGVGATPVLSYTNAATPVGQGALIITETFANAAANWTYASSQHSNVAVPLVLMRAA